MRGGIANNCESGWSRVSRSKHRDRPTDEAASEEKSVARSGSGGASGMTYASRVRIRRRCLIQVIGLLDDIT